MLAIPVAARADIFQWEYINPADPAQGKRPSTTLCRDGAGVNAVPGANLASRDLTKAYLILTDLTGASFQSATLTIADLSRADLTNASFADANLVNATLAGSNLSHANLANANLTSASLLGANLTGTNFTGAEVRGVNFVASSLTAAQLYSSASYQNHDLTGIDLSSNLGNYSGWSFAGQNLTGAKFTFATLTSANFSHANLTGAALGSVTAPGANFSYANFSNAPIDGTLTNANFSYANLTNGGIGGDTTGATFTGALITGAQFSVLTLAQLYSTASYQNHDLTGIGFRGNSQDFSGGNFVGQNLTNASLESCRLINANFTGAEVRGANFQFSELTPAQLYSTASYLNHDLNSMNLSRLNFAGASLAGQNLTNAAFAVATLAGADFTDAEVRGANFSQSDFTAAQLYSTASYQNSDLTGISFDSSNISGWNFAGQNLTSAKLTANLTGANLSNAKLINTAFVNANLDSANFTGADVRGATFQRNIFGSNGVLLTAAQLYSTASYQNRDLSGIVLADMDLTGWNFAGQKLTNARFGVWVGSNLAGADFTAADSRGAQFLNPAAFPSAITKNLIRFDGHVAGLDLTAGQSLVVRNYRGRLPTPNNPGTGPLPIVVDQHLTMDTTGTLSLMLDGDEWDSTISFAPGIPVTLGGTLELTFSAGVDLGAQAGRSFDVFDWIGVTPTGSFAVANAGAWDLSQLYTTGRVTFGTAPAWNVDVSGDWSTAGNWSGGAAPHGVGAIAKFGSAITAPRTITVDSAKTVGMIEFGNLNRYTLAGPAALTMDVASGSASINVTTGSHTIAAPLVLNDDLNVNVAPAASVLTLSGPLNAAGRAITKAGAGRLDLPLVTASGLNVSAGTARLASGAGTSRVNSLTIAGGSAPTAQLDVTNNALVIDYASGSPSPLATVRAQVASGFVGGSWNGNGIVSSAANTSQFAVGYGEASALPSVPLVFGEVDASAVLVRHTRYGDADLDGTVNLQDFNRLAGAFGTTGTAVWTQGDFDYDGSVNLQDFNRLAGNFGLSAAGPDVTPADWAALASAVPQPACGVTVLTLTALLRRVRAPRR